MISPTGSPVAQEKSFAASESEADITFAGTKDDGQKEQSPSTEVAVATADAVQGSGQAPVVAHQTEDDGEAWAFVYAQLARQLEYYFSEKNLSNDTYLQTLRQLNDGCVPVSILANFAMVRRLILSLTFVVDEEGRLASVMEAARNHSERLVVHLIDTQTGLRVADETTLVSDSSHCIMAIGTVDGEPLALDTSIPQPSPIVKTIVLRDVEIGVTPEEIYELFNYEDFPPVSSIQPDVANCWFVTLDTDDKNAVLQVLLSLRSMTLRDSPVHARLKSTAISTLVDTAPVMPWVPPVPDPAGEPAKRKKKKIRGKKKKNVAAPKKGKKGAQTKITPPPPPTLGEENFPTLLDKKVEWESASVLEKNQETRSSSSSEAEEYEEDEEEERIGKANEDEKDGPKSLKTMSDGASTATTTSSSLESVPKKANQPVGYAAALMKTATSTPSGGQRENVSSSAVSPVSLVDSKLDVAKVPEDRPMPATAAPKSDAWGSGRRSFAEIVRVSHENPSSASS